jgi:hypothetical protein
MDTSEFFDALWEDFVSIAPQAAAIRDKLERRGEQVHNDHVAFRTFDASPLRLEDLERQLFHLGYHVLEEYQFPEKHLRARAYLCAGAPRVFLSELLTEQLSLYAQDIVGQCMAEVEPDAAIAPEVFWAGRLWAPISHGAYLQLVQESEYAAWLCALGLHANHFTVDVGALRQLNTVEAVLDFVEREGYAINTAGGRVKGGAAELLEQGSTMADRMTIEFADGNVEIPTCYYEFARRYRAADGSLFEGFISGSADKIFESTHHG